LWWGLGWVVSIQGLPSAIPFRKSCKAKANTGFSEEKPVFFVFIMSFTKQVSFGHSKNKILRRMAEDLLWLCGERGIRTPGTVSHTAV
jgi:hypothetical protein